jgi:ubiquinone biosynthesis protein
MIFQHEGLGPHVDVLARTGNRLTFGLVLATMLIGSALMAQARMSLQWHGIPIIGTRGVLISGVMGFWLLISILRHSRM